tara:strand:+ start:853 stop:2322 length:1470 start_codon:yes stop_codon:yes gene_type:complete
MRSHNLRASLANSASGGGGGGDDLTTDFVEFSNRFINSNNYMSGGTGDYDGPYDVAQVQTNFTGTGRIYIGQKNTSSTNYRNDIAIAGVQILAGSTLVKSWIFNTSSGGTGSSWQTLNQQVIGTSSQGYPINPATAFGLNYFSMSSSGHNEDRWTFASGTGSSSTGAADGIADSYKLSADGGSSTIATVGDAQISQTSGTYYAYRETSGSSSHSGCVMKSPEYTFSGGEYIRIIHCLPGGNNDPMDADDSLYIAVEGGPSGTTSKVLELDANNYSGSGNWLDTSGSGNHATVNSSNSSLTWVNDGNADYWNFGSGTNRFTFSSAMFNPNQDHTFSIWIKMDSVIGGTYNSFTSTDDDYSGAVYRYFGNNGSSDGLQLKIHTSNSSYTSTFSNSNNLANSSIYNFTFVRYGNAIMCYINGVKTHPTTGYTLGSVLVNSDVTFTAPNNLGSDQSGDDDIEGRVYHVEAYSAARTDSQVLASFNALKSRYGY